MLIYWRPDLGLYRAVITEEVPDNTPFDPPFINDALTLVGGFIKPGNDASLQQNGQLMQGIHLAPARYATFLCQAFGGVVLDPSQFGWALSFRDNNGAVVPVVSDNATGLTNQMQVCSSARCLADGILPAWYSAASMNFSESMDVTVVQPCFSLKESCACFQQHCGNGFESSRIPPCAMYSGRFACNPAAATPSIAPTVDGSASWGRLKLCCCGADRMLLSTPSPG
jgi:hypothetical protein